MPLMAILMHFLFSLEDVSHHVLRLNIHYQVPAVGQLNHAARLH